jgi:glycosyltransferase involved in cell wall biosynthesis
MSKVILYSHEFIGTSMAGPGIRYFEFAKALSVDHEVILLTPNESDISIENVIICQINDKGLRHALAGSDVLITQLITPKMALFAKRAGVKIILDAYDPMPIEHLEVFKYHTNLIRQFQNDHILKVFRFSFQMADAVISGSSKQRDLWMGLLMNLGKITPLEYDIHNSLKHLIDVVPFGMSATRPKMVGEGFRKRFGIKEDAYVILWGGGVWNWFDPLTLIKAIGELSKVREDVYLVFMGLKPPNPHVPEMKMSIDAVNLAKELDLYEKKIFFNFGWTSYEERQSYLLESTIGASLHFEHLETQYSFRTRMLDYLWAGLPIIGTDGDYFADLIKKYDLGYIISQNDTEAAVQAIIHIIDYPENRERIRENIQKLRPQFYWEEVIKPIQAMIENFIRAEKKRMTFRDVSRISLFQLRQHGFKSFFRYALKRIYK